MAELINLTIKTNFAQASQELRDFGGVTEAQRAKIQKYAESFKSQQIDEFISRQERSTAAIKATRGPTEALTAEHRAYRNEIEKLIKSGLDPMDDRLQPLITKYQQLTDEMEENNAAQETGGKVSAITVASFMQIADKAIQVARKIYDISQEFIRAASEAQETESKFRVVFGSVADEAADAAANLAENFGMSHTAAQRVLSDTGDLLVGLGVTADEALRLSEQAAQLGTDLASFTNYAGGAGGAVEALRKAMLGETEMAKGLGLVLNDTQLKEYAERHGLVVKEMSLSEKAHARLEMAIEQSKNAIGDFARTQDSYANQTRIAKAASDDLKAALGEALLPAATKMVGIFGKIASHVAETITQFNVLREVSEQGAGTTASLEELESALKAVNEQMRARGTTNLQALADQRDLLEEIIAQRKQGLRWQEIEAQLTEEERARLQTITIAKEKAAEMEQGAAAIMKEYHESLLTAREKEIAKLQENIDTLAEYRNALKTAGGATEGIQAVINALIEQRDAMNENVEIIPETAAVFIENGSAIIGEAIVPMTEAEQEMWKKYGAGAAEAGEDTRTLAAIIKDDFADTASTAIEGVADAFEAWDGDAEEFIESLHSSFTDLASSIASQFGPAGEIAAAFPEMGDALIEATEAANDAVFGNLEDYADGYKDVQLQILEAQIDANDQIYANTKQMLDDQLAAAEITEDEYTTLLAEAAEAQEKADREYQREKAQMEREVTLAEVEIDRQAALANLGWFNWGKKGEVNALYDELVSAINAIPLPSLQTGTLPSGLEVPESASSRGDSSLVQFMAQPGERVSVTPRGESGGDQTIIAAIGEEVIFRVVNKGVRSGAIRISADNLV